MASITCGNCGSTHDNVFIVRACHDGATIDTCGWLVDRGWVEDVHIITECGADVAVNGRGWACSAGHEYTNMETRHAEGWEYAECEDEAEALTRAGVAPVLV